jgi:antitoxin HicB
MLSRRGAGRAARVHQENAENARGRLGPGETENEGSYEMKKRNNKHIGSSLEDFLKEEGVLEETRAVVLKETLAWQVRQAMEKNKISKVEMARRMNTSRAALDRLLDPGNASVTLQTLTRAAHAVGRDLRIELV